jgi:flagellar hook-length control protein FliK
VGVELVAETGAARQILEAHLTDLSRGLSDQGLELGRFSVSLDDGAQRQAADRHPPETTAAGSSGPSGDTGAGESAASATADRVALGMNRVDRVA